MSDLACEAIPGWFQPPEGIVALMKCYGAITVADGQVTTPGWESAHMDMFEAPWLPHGRLYVNKLVWPIFSAAMEACLAIGDDYVIKTIGCFSPRAKRVNGDLSTHSWGIAFDLNADDNPLQIPDGPVVCDIPDTWVATLKSCGFTWGGDFGGRKDCMHFQFCSGY